MDSNPTSASAIEAMRGAMRTTSDPRAARTRRAIIDAVRDLASDGQSAISVTDVVHRAGISRSAFYTQFAGVDGVAFELLAEAFAEIAVLDRRARAAAGTRTELAAQLSLHRLVTHFADHRSLYAGLLNRPGTGHAYSRATQLLAAEVATGIAGTQRDPDVNVAVAANYIAGGILAVLRSWCGGDIDASVGELVEQINALLPAWFSGPATTRTTPAPQDTSVTLAKEL